MGGRGCLLSINQKGLLRILLEGQTSSELSEQKCGNEATCSSGKGWTIRLTPDSGEAQCVWGGGVCVCVCVTEREKQTDGQTDRQRQRDMKVRV